MRFQTYQKPGLTIHSLPLGSFATNCFVMRCDETHQGAIIDSSGEPSKIDLMVDAMENLTITHLLQTHAHIDHVAALPHTRARFKAPVYLHKADMFLYDAAPMQGQMFGVHMEALKAPDHFLEEGDTVTVGKLTARILHLPGHTPGSICFYLEEQGVFFGGDVLFKDSIGRTDLPGGDTSVMLKSLERIRDELPDDTLVLSGHGPETTVGREKKHNYFLKNLDLLG